MGIDRAVRGKRGRSARRACSVSPSFSLCGFVYRAVWRMSLQELTALETAQAIENANYENVDVTYAVINEEDLLQAGSFQNLQTLVEVSSILAAQGVYTNPEQPSGKEQLVRQTILTEQPVQQEEQAYQQPLEPAAREIQLGTARRSRAAEVRECHVCGERAGKHSYYGGQVCPSRRAFFRRSVQSGYNSTYFCIKDGNCEVTLKTRKNCQYCRYKLCEAAGMKTTWVLTDEERKQKFEGRGKRKSCSGDSQPEENKEEASTAGKKTTLLSEEELSTVEGYVRASDYWEQSERHGHRSHPPDHPDGRLPCQLGRVWPEPAAPLDLREDDALCQQLARVSRTLCEGSRPDSWAEHGCGDDPQNMQLLPPTP